MPYKDPEKRKQQAKKYYKQHRERILAYTHDWWQRNKKEQLKKQHLRYQKRKHLFAERRHRYILFKAYQNRLEVLKAYSGEKPKCACCGEEHIEFLTVDHINGRKDVPETGQRLYRWLKINNYPEGFQVLCMNCNYAKGKFGNCPHSGKEWKPEYEYYRDKRNVLPCTSLGAQIK